MLDYNIFNGIGIPIKLQKEDDFLKIKETLTRIGISSKKDNSLYQSCHILHKQGLYVICHFKEMFKLDGKDSTLNITDLGRRNTICNLLEQWGLLIIINPDSIKEPTVPLSLIKIIPYKEKSNWKLVSKYQVGKLKFQPINS